MDLNHGISLAAGLLTDMENEEYIRGMCELLADMFPEEDVCNEERAELIRSMVEKQVLQGNPTQPRPSAS